MRRIPSLIELTSSARAAFVRFPETVSAGLVCALVGALAIQPDKQLSDHWVALLAALMLGIPLTFAVATAVENGVLPVRARRLSTAVVAAVLGLVFLASFMESGELFAIHVALGALAAHLFVAFLPYFGRGSDDAFWDYNQGLLVRFLLSVVYSAFLFVGIAIAMATVQYLFALKIPGVAYFRLWMVIAFAFNTWVLCGGIAQPLPSGPVAVYPRPLRILTQYILIPLVTLYVMILYGYVIQILIQHAWPRGTVGYLVSGFSVLGMLALLFVHPIREASESRWVRVYSLGFYLSLFPLLALLVLATWRRVSEYGLTEKRYLLLALGLWIAGVAFYFLVSRRRDIRVIPVSLCAVALLTTFGPWGAASMSHGDQLARLRGMLQRQGLLRDGRVQVARTPVDFATRKAISASLDYLTSVHRGHGLTGWFKPEALREMPPRGEISAAQLMTAMGLVYVSRWESQGHQGFSFYPQNRVTDTLTAVALGRYETMTTINFFRSVVNRPSKMLWVDGRRFDVIFDEQGVLTIHGDSASVLLPLAPLAWRLRSQYSSTSARPTIADMTVEAEGRGLDARLVAWGMNGTVEIDSTSLGNATLRINQLEGALFLRLASSAPSSSARSARASDRTPPDSTRPPSDSTASTGHDDE